MFASLRDENNKDDIPFCFFNEVQELTQDGWLFNRLSVPTRYLDEFYIERKRKFCQDAGEEELRDLPCFHEHGVFSDRVVTITKANNSKKRKDYDCKFEGCTKRYKTSEGLRLHIRNHHIIDKKWVCSAPLCTKRFVRQSDLRLHILRMHTKVRPYPCNFKSCQKSFACISELRRHQKGHLRKLKKVRQKNTFFT